MDLTLFPYTLTPEIVAALTTIANTVGKIEGMNLMKPAPGLRRKYRIQTVQSSLAIEGNTLTERQVSALIDSKRVVGPERDILEVKNALAVYEALSRYDAFSMVSLLDAHRVMMSGLLSEPGRFRKKPMGMIREGNIFHEAPPWGAVEPMMAALFRHLNNAEDHLLLRSCHFHYQFEFIHPFEDGNGRVGRLWQTRILMIYHPVFEYLPVEHLVKENQEAYYRALAESDETKDCTSFIAFILEQIQTALLGLLNETRSVTLTVEDRIAQAASACGSETFSRKDYQDVFKGISTATASRDLSYGVNAGLLKRTGNRRTTVYHFITTT